MNTINKSTVGSVMGFSRKHIHTLETQALNKLRPIFEYAREIGVDLEEVSHHIIEDSERCYQDQVLIALAEDLNLETPTHRFESFEDSLRHLFQRAEQRNIQPEFELQ